MGRMNLRPGAGQGEGIVVAWSLRQLHRDDESAPIHIMREDGVFTLCGLWLRYQDGGWREDETHASCKRCLAIYAKRKAKGAGDGD